MAESKGLVKGAIIGGAVGAAAALLLAPKSGRELRQDIRSKYNQASDKAMQWMSDAGAKTKEVASQVSQHATDLVDKTKSVVRAVKDEAETAAASAASQKPSAN